MTNKELINLINNAQIMLDDIKYLIRESDIAITTKNFDETIDPQFQTKLFLMVNYLKNKLYKYFDNADELFKKADKINIVIYDIQNLIYSTNIPLYDKFRQLKKNNSK